MKGRSYLLALALPAMLCLGQTTESGRAIGEVTAVNAAAHEIALKLDGGGAITVKLTDKTVYLRVPPGEKDLKNATRIALDEVAAGDRVYARGAMSEDRKSIEAVRVIAMTKADLARKHEADRAEWQKRGTAGTVTAVDPAAREITISVGPREDARAVIVEAPASTALRRYAPDSVRFADAQPSSFAALKVGDRLRVLGDRSADGSRIRAEEIVFGAFRNIAGLVKSVDPATGEIRVTDLETKQPVLVRTNADSMLRRIPQAMATMIARRREMAAGGGEAPRGPRNGADFQQALERMPALTLAEIKPGDALIISSTKGADAAQVTAIVVVAGVEPLLASSSASPGLGGLGGALNFEVGPQ
jgi:Cu/Ag efflux protein CusF